MTGPRTSLRMLMNSMSLPSRDREIVPLDEDLTSVPDPSLKRCVPLAVHRQMVQQTTAFGQAGQLSLSLSRSSVDDESSAHLRRVTRQPAIQARARNLGRRALPEVRVIRWTTSKGFAHTDFGTSYDAWPTLPSSRSLEFHSVEACNSPPNSTGSRTHLVVARIPRGIE